MRRMVTVGACALALLGIAGCADGNSWFGGTSSRSAGAAGSSGSTATATPGNSGSEAVSGQSTPTTGRSPIKLNNRGAGVADDSAERGRAYYPGTLSGEGRWNADSDAPGAN